MSADQLIDGVGNEVTIIFGLIFGGFVLVLVWMSTRVSDRSYNHYMRNNSAGAQSPQSQNVPEEGNPLFQTAADYVAQGMEQETSDSDVIPEEEPATNRYSAPSDTQESAEEPDDNDANLSNADMSTPAHMRRNHPLFQSDSAEQQPDHFPLRLKFLDESFRVIQVKPTNTIGELRRKYFPPATASRYRMIFRGQVLRNDSSTLVQYGVQLNVSEDSLDTVSMPVVHCFLSSEEQHSNRPGSASQQMHQMTEELNVAHFFLPLLGSVLAFLWYLCVFHTTLFTLPSIFGIVALTCFFIVMAVNQTTA